MSKAILMVTFLVGCGGVQVAEVPAHDTDAVLTGTTDLSVTTEVVTPAPTSTTTDVTGVTTTTPVTGTVDPLTGTSTVDPLTGTTVTGTGNTTTTH